MVSTMIECRIYDKIQKNKIKALWGVMPCSLLDRYQHFKGICSFPADGSSRFFLNRGTCL